MSPLQGQVAVVLGAASGIGRAIALALHAQGVIVCLVGRRPEALQAVATTCEGAQSARARCYQVDLAVDDEVDALAGNLLRDFAGVDMLVHSAATIRLSPIESASTSDLDHHYKVNFRAPYVVTRGLLHSLCSRRGQVLFVNSSVGLSAKADVSQYAATKHALKAFADSLRAEVNSHGVRVTSLFLGRTATPMQANVHSMEGRLYRPELLMQPEDIAEVAVHTLSLPRRVEVTDINIRSQAKSY